MKSFPRTSALAHRRASHGASSSLPRRRRRRVRECRGSSPTSTPPSRRRTPGRPCRGSARARRHRSRGRCGGRRARSDPCLDHPASNTASAFFGPSLVREVAERLLEARAVAGAVGDLRVVGLEPAATETALRRGRSLGTYSATWLICTSFSCPRTPACRDRRSRPAGRRVGGPAPARRGSARPSRSTSQPRACGSRRSPQSNTFAPGKELVGHELSPLCPPHPARTRRARLRRATPRMGDARTRHIEAKATGSVEPEPTETRTFSFDGYSLTLVGVVGQQPRTQCAPLPGGVARSRSSFRWPRSRWASLLAAISLAHLHRSAATATGCSGSGSGRGDRR